MMKNMLGAFYAKPLALYLIVALSLLSTLAGPAEAMFVPSSPDQHRAEVPAAMDRASDLAGIQSALELKVVRQKLLDYGLSPEETMARVKALSDEQVHLLATHSEALQAGGDAVGFLFSVVILALLIVLLIFLIQGRIVIK